MADGSLTFDTKVDDSGFVEGIQKMSSKQIRLQNVIKKTQQEMAKLEQAMNDLSNAKAPTQEYQEIQKQITETQKKLDKYLEIEQRMKDTGANLKGAAWKNLQWKIEDARKTLNAAREDMKELEASGGAFTIGGDATKLADMQSKYELLKGKLSEYKARLSEVSDKESQNASSSSRVSKALGGITSAVSRAWSGMKKLGGIAGSVFGKLGKLVSGAGKAMGGLLSGLRRMNSLFSRGQKGANKFGMSIGRVLKSVILYQGISRIFRSLVKTMWSAMQTNDTFVSNLSKVKGNLYTAFQPIFEAAMPAINALMNGLVKLTGHLAQFTSMMFGKSVQASQAAAKSQYEQAKALEDTAKASKDANKQLSSIDKLNVISDSESSGSSSNEIKPNFSTDIETSEDVSGFVEQLKKAWSEADFTEIGGIIASKINQLVEHIDWSKLQSVAKDMAKSLYTGVNGFVGGLDWATIGDAIGNGINTAVTFANTLVAGVDWSKLGTSMGTGLQSAINKINWTGIGQLISNGINSLSNYINNFYKSVNWTGFGSNIASSLNTAISNTNWADVGKAIGNALNMAINTAYGLITTFDWSGFGLSIADGINNFLTTTDWIKLAKGASSLAKGLLDTCITAIKSIDWQGLGNTIGDMISNIDWLGLAGKLIDLLVAAFNGLVSFIFGIGETIGKNIADGLSEGITLSEILGNAWKWVKEHIFNPIVDNIKKLFGIHSPSTVMMEIGKYIIQGLANGIESLIDTVKTKFSDLVKNIKSFFTNLPTWFSDKFTSALNKIKSVFSTTAISNHFSGIWSDIKSCFSGVTTWFKDTFTEAWTNVKNVFSTGGKIFDGIKEGIGDTFKAVVNRLIDGINTIISVPFNAINGMLNKIRDISIMGISPFSGLWSVNPLSVPKIPKLATGTVVPKNYGEFAAILGDNKREAEVVSPLSTIERALENVLSRTGSLGVGEIHIHLEGDARGVFRLVRAAENENYKTTGNAVFVH